MEKIKVGELEFSVVRSKRRTVCMRVQKDGTPQILAPFGIGEKELRRIAEPYTERITREIECNLELSESRRAFRLTYGDAVRFLGGERIICRGEDSHIGYDEKYFYIPDELSDDEIKAAVIAVYKLAAKNYLPLRVNAVAPLMGCDVKAIKINSATSHWASCSKRDTLNFSWYCVMAKPETVDYIIIHELSHMYEFNHSQRFWTIVERYCPDYKSHKKYLRELWRCIAKENWKL